jgi:phospholipid/cholesterol/gamma-HCH transport system substrate-binding protein
MGINVGTVKNVTIVNDTVVEVSMVIKEDVRQFIKKDAYATVGSEGLMGNRLINIVGGSPSTAMVDENDVIRTIKPVSSDDILRSVDYTSQYTAILSNELVKLVKEANRGKGVLGTIIKDSVVASDLKFTMRNLNHASEQANLLVKDFRNTMSDVNSSNGSVGSMIHDTAMKGNLTRTFQNLNTASSELSESVKNIRSFSQTLKQSQGPLYTVVQDTSAAADLRNTLAYAKTGVISFSEDMEALKHNFLFRGYFRRQEKKQKKANQKH